MSKITFFRMRSNEPLPELTANESYYSCAEIEGAITFIHSAISMCGHMHSVNKGMPIICEYKGGDIPVEKIISAREELRRKNQTEVDTPCKGCQFLEKRQWPKNKYLVDHITVGHYSLCNLRCSYCYITDYTKEQKKLFFTPPYNAADSLTHLVKQGLMSPETTAWLTAGEPTLFADFEQTMDILLAHNIKTTIGTNCTKSYEIIKRGLSDNLIEVLCSVDAGTHRKYIEVKGKDCFDAVWNTLRDYALINKELVIVKYILMEENSSEVEALSFINMCRQNNIGKISISRDILKYQGVLSPSREDMPEEMFQIIVLMMYEAVKSDIKVFFDVNWPVFTSDELLKIKLMFLETLIREAYPLSNHNLELYFGGIANLFDLIMQNSKSTNKKTSP